MGGPATGKHIAAAISDVLAETIVKANAVGASHGAAVKNAGTTAFLESLERELAPHMEQITGWLANHPELPDHLRPIVEQVTTPSNQFGVLEQIAMFISMIVSAISALGQPALQSILNDLWADFPYVPLSPAEAATAVIKGWMTQDQAWHEARKSGVNDQTFDHMVKIAGNPPGPGELLDAHRKGIINVERFMHGIAQGHIRTEWADVWLRQFFEPLDLGTVVAAAVQAQLPYNEAAAVAAKHGINSEDFDTLYRVHGNPPGPETAGEMYRRGILNKEDAKQAIRESHLKNKYVDAVLEHSRRLPPQDSIRMMVANGALPVEKGVAKLMEIGYNADDAKTLISEAVNRKHGTSRDLAQSQILRLYTEGGIDEAQATAMLKTLGYDPQEVGWLMALADHEREKRYTDAAVNRLHTLYVAHKMERDVAGTQLDRLHIPSKQRDHVLALWDIERNSNVAHLTAAQVNRAYEYNLITEGEWKKELQRMGYDDWSIGVLRKLYGPPPTA